MDFLTRSKLNKYIVPILFSGLLFTANEAFAISTSDIPSLGDFTTDLIYYIFALAAVCHAFGAVYSASRGHGISIMAFMTSVILLTVPYTSEFFVNTLLVKVIDSASTNSSASDKAFLYHRIACLTVFTAFLVGMLFKARIPSTDQSSDGLTNNADVTQRDPESLPSLNTMSRSSSNTEASVASNISMAKHSVSDGLSERAPVPGKRKLSID